MKTQCKRFKIYDRLRSDISLAMQLAIVNGLTWDEIAGVLATLFTAGELAYIEEKIKERRAVLSKTKKPIKGEA